MEYFKIGRQIIWSVKYAYNFVLLARKKRCYRA